MRVYVDIESTGLDCRVCDVVEVGAVAIEDLPEGGWSEKSAFEAIVNPGESALRRVSVDRALSVNGLTREMIAAGVPIVNAVAQFRKWLTDMEATALHSYDVGFDKGFLEMEPWAINPLSWGECVMRAASSRRKPISLERACAKFGIEWDATRAHRALYDARQAARVHMELRRQRQGAVA